jgi:predicted amidohydrolase
LTCFDSEDKNVTVPIRIAQIKIYPVRGDCAANQARLLDLLDEIAPHQPDVVVTPECFLDGYVADSEVTGEQLPNYAIDPANSAEVTAIQHWTASHRAWMIYGCMRRTSAGVYNTALIFNRHGELAGHYDKTHLQTHDLKFLPGQALPVFDSDLGMFGVMICADRRWPETVRTLALQGAKIIFNPTYGMYDDRNRRMMQTRSWESEIMIAFTHPGQSLITGPRGEIVQDELSAEIAFTITDVDLTTVDQARSKDSHLQDRRPDLYL